MKYTYLLVDLCCLLPTFLLSFHPRIRFHKEWKFLWAPGLLTAAFFILWDLVFTRAGVWSFNSAFVTGYYFFELPVEELLFFFCIPYACVFTYHCVRQFFHLKESVKMPVLIMRLSIFLLVFGLAFFDRRYTSVTFTLLAVFILLVRETASPYFKSFLLAYSLVLPFFVLSNGVLTGSFGNEAVVRYNDEENLGVRLLNIPVEDVFYGMLLVLMNVTGFEWMRRRSRLGSSVDPAPR